MEMEMLFDTLVLATDSICFVFGSQFEPVLNLD